MEIKDYEFLDLAYQQAEIGRSQGGVPIGAVLVLDDKVIAQGHNKRVQENSMIKHGETDCLENTKRQISPKDMQRTTLYTTLSPCYMCAGTILLNKIPRVIIGENKTFQQSEALLLQNQVKLVIANDQKCINTMLHFIFNNQTLWGEDIGLTPEQVYEKYKDMFMQYKIDKSHETWTSGKDKGLDSREVFGE